MLDDGIAVRSGRRVRGEARRAASIVAAARRILEEEGRDALTMRRLGAAVGIRAPSLYKHFPDKSSVEVALIEIGFEEMADVAQLRDRA